MEYIRQFFSDAVRSIFYESSIKLIGTIFAALLLFWFGKNLNKIWKSVFAPFRNTKKINRIRNAINSEKGIWISIPVQKSKIRNPNCDVALIANLKGGVGKTTITANLSAFSAVKRVANTLCIDFDYQGSLTSMALPDFTDDVTNGGNSRAGNLVKGEYTDEQLFANAIPLPQKQLIKFIPADYPLAQIENRMMIEWLLGDLDFDVRTQLAEKFNQTPYDRIIIDAPPRLTTSCVQGIFAATHIIIPTILDRLSTEAVGRFIEQIYDLQRNNLCPFLQKISVVGTMVRFNQNLYKSEYAKLQLILKQYAGFVDLVPFELSVPETADLGRAAGHEIVYLNKSKAQNVKEIRQMFDKLGNYLWPLK